MSGRPTSSTIRRGRWVWNASIPALPVGAFSYSHGLEWAIEDGTVKSIDMEAPGKFEVSSADACLIGLKK